MDVLPDWASRQLLGEALRSAGLPVVYGAMYRRPRAAWMTYDERMLAVALEGQVIAEARRRLPPGVSGAAIGLEFRSMAWACIVAGLTLLDVDARCRLAGDGATLARDPERSPVEPDTLAIRRRPVEATVAPAAGPQTFTIRRRGEVARAS